MTSYKLSTIDLGSNSFYMLISMVDANGKAKPIYRSKSKVQLRSGLTDNFDLTSAVKTKALKCLSGFADDIKRYNVKKIKIVGTYTLRKAQPNISSFIQKAEKIIGSPIEIISGEEEARLVYIGSTFLNGVLSQPQKRLVIDIGGGSTEIVIGQNRDLKVLESLEVGCVSIQNKFFYSGNLSLNNFTQAIDYVKEQIKPIADKYINEGWDGAFGSSGTIVSICNIAKASNLSNGEITFNILENLIAKLVIAKDSSNFQFKGLRSDRESVFAGGICILYAIFDCLKIKNLIKSHGAIREGVLHEFLSEHKSCEA